MSLADQPTQGAAVILRHHEKHVTVIRWVIGVSIVLTRVHYPGDIRVLAIVKLSRLVVVHIEVGELFDGRSFLR